jgi:hypothetical protein
MTTTVNIPQRGIRPVGFGEVSVGREMIRVAQEGQKKLGVLLGQWEMILTFFKHGLEIPLCITPDNKDLKEQHRFILTGAMSLGELLLAETKATDDAEIKNIGYSKAFINANIRYLRDTYQAWYVERDSSEVEQTFKQICDASDSTSPKGAGA